MWCYFNFRISNGLKSSAGHKGFRMEGAKGTDGTARILMKIFRQIILAR